MTPLPERKKTAEELEELRANLGVPDQLPPDAPGAGPPGAQQQAALPAKPLPAPAPEKKADRTGKPAPAPGGVEKVEEREASAGSGRSIPRAKPVRSLKRSEREPRERPPRRRKAPKDSDLPARRHSDGELQQLRMQNAVEAKPPIERINSQQAHWLLLALGYLLAIAGGIGGIAVAALVFFRKPRSSHHSAWMIIIAVLVLVFGILYLFSKTDGP